jgi:hypothetical protein
VSGDRFIKVRKLAAFDLYFRRPSLTLLEFAFAVFGFGTLGFVAVFLGLTRSVLAAGIGVYLLFLGIDYAPLLAYGILILRRSSPKEELGEELDDIPHFRRKYGIQQTLLMVPLVIPALAVTQELRKT